MKLKKAGALGLSCVIALGSMAGCGSSKEKEKTDGKEEISGEIRYAFWDTTQQPYFEKCIEKFNEQYGCESYVNRVHGMNTGQNLRQEQLAEVLQMYFG